ncbi:MULTISPECIES: hypothetical protein [unclassified Pseudomonas]|uniref:hypothetical protein n=1 Tax=unclassified Pseudomonas TaxID=196821 RepID=UPI001F56FD1A|nr:MULTISPECIES: hypothetical protein [unclassified Pseudomonas]
MINDGADPDATWSDPDMQAASRLHNAIDQVNQCVYQQNVARHMSEGSCMGTTLTGLWRPQLDGAAAGVPRRRQYAGRDNVTVLLAWFDR